MSLKTNVVANYASQFYATIISIVMVPLYLSYMGAEAYGLVGFFAMFQAWFSLLDMGLTPTMSRETARFHGGAIDALTFRRLVRALEVIFLLVALVGGGILIAASGVIARKWLNVSSLTIDQVTISVKLMAGAIALRWMSGLYRGQISGAERLVWLSSYNSLIATIRFCGVIVILIFVSATPAAFFAYQLIVAAGELSGLLLMTYRLLPSVSSEKQIIWTFASLKPVFKFSLNMSFASVVWVAITQTDKLILSKILPLADYAFFTLAVLVASGIMMTSTPISGAIIPRMTKLEARGDHNGVIQVYRQSTQLVTALTGSACITVFLFAEPLLWVWTGNKALATNTAPVLKLYAIGNGLLAVSAFPYYLQFAKGNLRLHLIGNALFVLFLIPAIIWAAKSYGALGAGYVWLGMNGIYFLLWVPLVHHKLVKGLHIQWMLHDVCVVGCVALVTGFVLHYLLLPLLQQRDRFSSLVVILSAGFFILFFSAIGTEKFRSKLIECLPCRGV